MSQQSTEQVVELRPGTGGVALSVTRFQSTYKGRRRKGREERKKGREEKKGKRRKEERKGRENKSPETFQSLHAQTKLESL